MDEVYGSSAATRFKRVVPLVSCFLQATGSVFLNPTSGCERDKQKRLPFHSFVERPRCILCNLAQNENAE